MIIGRAGSAGRVIRERGEGMESGARGARRAKKIVHLLGIMTATQHAVSILKTYT